MERQYHGSVQITRSILPPPFTITDDQNPLSQDGVTHPPVTRSITPPPFPYPKSERIPIFRTLPTTSPGEAPTGSSTPGYFARSFPRRVIDINAVSSYNKDIGKPLFLTPLHQEAIIRIAMTCHQRKPAKRDAVIFAIWWWVLRRGFQSFGESHQPLRQPHYAINHVT